MAVLRVAVVACLLLQLSTGSTVTPVEKVISLISDMKDEVEKEGKDEAKTYDEFACFCKDTSATKSKSITEGQDNIDDLSATIEDKDATKVEKLTELGDRKKKQEELAALLAKTKSDFQKDEAHYEEVAADTSKGISSLDGAIHDIEHSKPASASLLQSVKRNLIVADALNMIEKPKQKALTAFLQGGAKVDPSDSEYKFHAQGILDTLDKLEDKFRGKKEQLDTEWAKTEKNYNDKIADIKKEMAENKTAMETLESEIDTLKSEIADARGRLVEAQSMLTDDEAYLKDLTKRCADRANDWDQRSAMRRDELEALSTALTILENKVKDADEEANKRALLQEPAKDHVAAPVVASTSFLQAASTRNHALSLLEKSRELSTQAKRDKMVSLLSTESKRLGSAVLASLAMKVAADPFAKVKELIQKLIERLVKEATEEAEKKGFCDTELGKARSDRDYRLTDVNKLNADLAGLEAKEDFLEDEIEELTKALKELEENHAKQTKMRAQEKEENLKTISTAKGGLAAVTDALNVLKAFYKKGAKAAAFVQYSPVDDDTAGAGFKGSYQGNQEGSKAILGLLQTIVSDFERTIKTTTEMEAKSAADYVDFDRTTKADIGGKTTKKTLDEEDLKTTKSTITKKMGDLKTNMDLLDKSLMELEELKPACIDSGMSYKERVQKREEEMEALKKAMCMLDADGVEPDCK